MSGLPFTARRRRRCTLGARCPHGGTIRIGESAVRVRPHRYMHLDDLPALVAAMVEAAQSTVRAFSPMVYGLAHAAAAMNRLAPLLTTGQVLLETFGRDNLDGFTVNRHDGDPSVIRIVDAARPDRLPRLLDAYGPFVGWFDKHPAGWLIVAQVVYLP